MNRATRSLLAALCLAVAEPGLAPRIGAKTENSLQLLPGSLSAGNGYVCGLRSDSSAICWGEDSSGQTDPPGGRFVAISAGASGSARTCGIRPAGRVVCWGAHSRLHPPGRFIQISTGGFTRGMRRGTGCGLLRTRRVECWSIAVRSGQAVQSVSERPGYFTQVSAGGGFACGVRRDQSVSCWGSRALADSQPLGTAARVAVWGALRASTHEARPDGPAACILGVDGSVRCWGRKRTDLGNAPADVRFSDIAVGQALACGLTLGATVTCWGRAGAASVVPANGVPVAGIAAGTGFVCELSTVGSVGCVHDGYQAADGWTAETAVPGTAFSSVSAGYAYDCGVRVDDSLSCWGALGTLRDAPAGTLTEYSIDQTSGWGCGVRRDGRLWCQGNSIRPPAGRYQRIDINSEACAISDASKRIGCWGGEEMGPPPSGTYRSVAVGFGFAGSFACGLNGMGRARCWGDGRSPVSGHKDGQTSPPDAVLVQVVATDGGACGLTVAGRALCWGDGGEVPLGTFTQIAMGSIGVSPPWRLCGIIPDGSIVCGTRYGRQLLPGGPYRQLSLGDGDLCAVDALGGIRCWGEVRIRIPSLSAPPGYYFHSASPAADSFSTVRMTTTA